MNKKSVILGIILFIAVIFTTGCMFYKVVDIEEFKNHFTAIGYTISENETPKYDTAKKYLVATKEDIPFRIEYYNFENEVEAKKVYEKFKKAIVDYITSDSQNQETTGAVFSKIVANSEKEYLVISRVKNTIIFIAGTQDYKSEINTLVEDIKY